MIEEYYVQARSGCEKGAIGSHYPIRTLVMAESHDDALAKAYEEMEHLVMPYVTCVRTRESCYIPRDLGKKHKDPDWC